MQYTDKGRWATIEIKFIGGTFPEIHEVYIMNDKAKYDELCADDAFDERVWFYFGDEEEYKSYFKEDNGDEWFIVREINE
jgi:hypothetical protein